MSLHYVYKGSVSCADPEKFCLRESIFDNICFLVDEGTEDPYTAINGSSSACQQNAIEMASRWRANNGPTLNAVLVALLFFRRSRPVLQRNPIFS